MANHQRIALSWMRATRVLAVSTSLCALAACSEGPGVAGPDNRGISRGGSGPGASTALVGTWRRAIFFIDDFGFARSTETSFIFTADGAASRLRVDRNLTFGLFDTQLEVGQWQLNGNSLIINFASPSAFELTLSVQITGDQLVLSGQTFLRVS